MSVPAASAVSLIERKRNGEALTEEEIRLLCRGFVDGSIPDYQVAAWLMAVYFRGMTDAETLALTLAMVESGKTLDWSHLGRPPVDKHSTGGVGDKTSLVLVPLMASLGFPFVKMSGRGLGHTGGTLDKLESIPGFRVDVPIDALRAQIDTIGCALVGQSAELVPADGKLYGLRDVTSTVDSLPLIASSIMSKKLAAGAGIIVLDVKYGSGAFMQSVEQARELAMAMVKIGGDAGRRVSAVLSPMGEPLGRAVGNSLEVREAIETLRGGGPDDLWELVRMLATEFLFLAGEAGPESVQANDEGRMPGRLERARLSGEALERFARLIEAQGGDPRVTEDLSLLPAAPIVGTVEATDGAWVKRVDARQVAEAALALGAGRRKKSDPVDPAVGVVLLKRKGERVEPGEPIAEIHARTEDGLREADAIVRDAFSFSAAREEREVPRYETVGYGRD